MSTFSELCDSTYLYLSGFTTLQDQATHLSANMTSSATTLAVADSSAISRGIIEIGSELLWVDSVDTQNNLVTVAPYGRGFRGTSAAAHSAGDRVVTSPLFPRSLIKQVINEAIRSVYPDLYGIGETTVTFSPAILTYALPAGAQQVLQASWQTIGPSKEWMPLRRWRVDRHAAPASWTTGVNVSVYDMVVPGRAIRFVYSKQPSPLVNDSDDFVTVTGLPASSEDVVRLGAAYRLVPFFDTPHLSGSSAESDFASNMRPVGGSSQLGRYMLQMYQMRLQEEVKRLQELYPVRSHYTR